MSAQNGQTSNGVPAAQGPRYVDYQSRLSKMAAKRKPTVLRTLMRYVVPENINLGGGLPNPCMFPILEAEFKLRDGSTISIDQKEMAKCLQYGVSEGYAPTRQWLIELQTRVHAPPTLDPNHPGHLDLIITNGSTEAINLVFNMLVGEGDTVLFEEASYSTTFDAILPLGAQRAAVKADSEGLLPGDLERVLTTWEEAQPGKRKPRLLYVICSGGNPTGVSWSAARKRVVYEIARAHDLLIIEDDAYFFLQYAKPVSPSLLSMDVDGRVIRMDTVSKIVAPGFRVGIITGPKPLLDNLRLAKDVSSISSSGISQALLSQYLRHLGHDGFLRHVDSVSEFYKQKMHTAIACAQRHLTGVCEWTPPAGGMFLWVRVLGVEDSRWVMERLLDRGVVMVAGRYFRSDGEPSPRLRVNFALASDEQLDEAFSVMAEVIREAKGK